MMWIFFLAGVRSLIDASSMYNRIFAVLHVAVMVHWIYESFSRGDGDQIAALGLLVVAEFTIVCLIGQVTILRDIVDEAIDNG